MTGDVHDDALRDPAATTSVLEVDDRPGDGDPASEDATTRRRRSDPTRTRGTRSPAAQRALDRRRRRTVQRSTAELTGDVRRPRGWSTRVFASPADAVRRMPFAVLVVTILAIGLALTLWLSTTAAEDSYGLSEARDRNATLSAQYDALNKQWESADAAPELAKKAGQLGMIPSKDVARLVVGPDNQIRMVGDPTPASGAPAPALNDGAPRTVVPQPGSSTDGNTAQAPGVGTATGAADPATAPAPNVLPGSGTAQTSGTPTSGTQTAPGGQVPGGSVPSSAQPAAQAPAVQQGQSGSTDSSVPR